MIIMNQIVNCKYCGREFFGDFCFVCGYLSKLKWIDGCYLLFEISSVFNFDKGILYIVWELFFWFGESVCWYIWEDCSKLMKFVIFVIVCLLFYMFVQ